MKNSKFTGGLSKGRDGETIQTGTLLERSRPDELHVQIGSGEVKVEAKDQMSGVREWFEYMITRVVHSSQHPCAVVGGSLTLTLGFVAGLEYCLERRPTPQWDVMRPQLENAMDAICAGGPTIEKKTQPHEGSVRVAFSSENAIAPRQKFPEEQDLWMFHSPDRCKDKLPSGALDLKHDSKNPRKYWGVDQKLKESIFDAPVLQLEKNPLQVATERSNARGNCAPLTVNGGLHVFTHADGRNRMIIAYNDLPGESPHVLHDLKILSTFNENDRLGLQVVTHPAQISVYGDPRQRGGIPLNDFVASYCGESN